jgi:hypothetical protein
MKNTWGPGLRVDIKPPDFFITEYVYLTLAWILTLMIVLILVA